MTRFRNKVCLLSVLITVILGCFPVTVRPSTIFYAPASYTVYWEEMVRCSGITPPVFLWQIQFRVVPGKTFLVEQNGQKIEVVGLSERNLVTGKRTIFLSEWSMHMPDVIKHEMLHTILNNRPGHPTWPGTWPCRVWVGDGWVPE